jgi:ribose transport system permease protein
LPIQHFTASERIVEPILTLFSLFSIVMLVAAAALWSGLKYLRAGRELYALGGGRTEALAAGVPIQAKMIVVFAVSAGLAALGGSLSAISAGGATPEGWESLLLTSVTAVLVGGVTLSGGVGNVLGVVLGAIAIQSISAGVAIEGTATTVSQFLIAGLLCLVLAFEGVSRMLAARHKNVGLADISESTT